MITFLLVVYIVVGIIWLFVSAALAFDAYHEYDTFGDSGDLENYRLTMRRLLLTPIWPITACINIYRNVLFAFNITRKGKNV